MVVLLVALAACAPKRIEVQTGAGTPVKDWSAQAFERATARCRDVRTLRGEIRVSGRAGRQRLRGTLVFGLEQPDGIRVEGIAPFGAPMFILAGRGMSATLLLPRDNRVLTGVAASDVLDALAGIRLDPASLGAVLSGCLVVDARPSDPRAYAGGWTSVTVAPDATAWLRTQGGEARLAAGSLRDLVVAYADFDAGLPRTVRLQSPAGTANGVNLTLALARISTNVSINPAAWTVVVPHDAVPLTLDELRQSGPLGVKGGDR